ncbi:VWA domain-containing protein [Candidatus Mycobacterium wuenschmannii]|uniref:VWA domain-containing protein n=1 Tax=Candidatus Mycobacterium wuenschmannii TaxID=3027808 RepID=A0ABY8W4I6_9MYCO|nr:VWA domain-containing protein [Candidatus Mycobacterium wuenschmannii]WIM90466.1 VWA domain-containing protein [Candidatus Mycobacterium wuenschmannii]
MTVNEADLLHDLGVFASAFAGRAIGVDAQRPGEPTWTDGQTIYVDPSASLDTNLEAIAVQASMIAAGSFDPEIARQLGRHSRLARRYLAVEGHRALVANAEVLPRQLASLGSTGIAERTGSPQDSLALAGSKDPIDEPPAVFGAIRANKVLAAGARATKQAEQEAPAHVPRRGQRQELEELDDDAVDDTDDPDLFTSPVGGGGFIGKWLKKMLSSARKTGSGGGPPGADTPTHRTNSGTRGAYAVSSLASASSENVIDHEADLRSRGVKYPEWDAGRKSYRHDWCTVVETEPVTKGSASSAIDAAIGVRRPLARLGMGLHRSHRQPQGDDLDIDAVVEARVEAMAGSVPDEAVYLDSMRRRRDLSVLLLLDISGSTAEAGTVGRTVHEQQRAAVANLTVALHDLGDRVALYAYYSQGRGAVSMVPVKRFDHHLDSQVLRRLNSLEPGAYSRLGAAIRHGSAVLEARGGTSRRLLVVLSDGLAYDHGYERAYGAADARRALSEARRRGTGCVCLTVGAGTDVESLRRVFGSTAHASVARPDELTNVIGPLFRSAIRSAEVRRRVS